MVFRTNRSVHGESIEELKFGESIGEGKTSATGTRYRLVERLAAIGDDFFIQTDAGKRVFKVDGRATSTRDALAFEDMHGNVLCEIQRTIARLRDTLAITGPGGQLLATIQKQMITPVRERFLIELACGSLLSVEGNLVSHEFFVDGPFGRVAEVSRRWFRARNSYGVQITPGQNDVLVLAAVVGIDHMIEDVQ